MAVPPEQSLHRKKRMHQAEHQEQGPRSSNRARSHLQLDFQRHAEELRMLEAQGKADEKR
jgi:hypothetical protein